MKGARILVVDDHRDMANGIAMLLAEKQGDVQVAHSAEDALAWMERQEFELLLSDIRMPGMSGLMLLKHVRARWPLTKVVLLTAYGTIDSAVDAMRTGACDYLTKPFDNDDLLRVLSRALTLGASSGGLDDSAVVGEVVAALSGADLRSGLERALAVLVQASGADDGEIFLCEPEGRDPLLCAWSGPDGGALGCRTRFELGLGYPGIVAAAGAPLCVKGGLGADARYLRRAVIDAGICSLVAAPLPDTNGALGSIHLMSRREDFPVQRVLDLLTGAAVPISNAIRAALAALRQSVDALCYGWDDSGQALRRLLESIQQVAGARHGTLALVDPATGRPNQVVSSHPGSLVCAHAEAGAWADCPASVLAAHGSVADPGRRDWPMACRRGLPRRATSPCCLPLVANGSFYGLVVLDFGREGAAFPTGRLVPLLSMANQLAIRLQSRQAGLVVCAPHGVEPSTARAPAELELRCLGPFAVLRRGQPIAAEAFTRSKALVLLKLLALKAGAPVQRDVLIEHLWPEVEPELGANRLYGVVHDLRSVIEPPRAGREWTYVRNRGEVYYLDLEAPIELDLLRFRQLLTRASRAVAQHDEQATSDFERAIELYRGELFEDEPFAEWCATERVELSQAYLAAVERLGQIYAGQGADDKTLGCLQRALRSAPFRDDLLLSLMEQLCRLGRPAEAVAACNDYERRLRAELGAEPSAPLTTLRRRLLASMRGSAREGARPNATSKLPAR